jgi:hypothetical protein
VQGSQRATDRPPVVTGARLGRSLGQGFEQQQAAVFEFDQAAADRRARGDPGSLAYESQAAQLGRELFGGVEGEAELGEDRQWLAVEDPARV